jgi:hypothetical protein
MQYAPFHSFCSIAQSKGKFLAISHAIHHPFTPLIKVLNPFSPSNLTKSLERRKKPRLRPRDIGRIGRCLGSRVGVGWIGFLVFRRLLLLFLGGRFGDQLLESHVVAFLLWVALCLVLSSKRGSVKGYENEPSDKSPLK